MYELDEIILPGGVVIDNKLHRKVGFKQLTGHIENKLEEILSESESIVEKVNKIFLLTIKQIGGLQPTKKMVLALSIADRQYLMRRLTNYIEGSQLWLHPECSECGNVYDLGVDRNNLPIQEAQEMYPYKDVVIQNKNVRVRVPTGKDQQQIHGLNNNEAIIKLAFNCIETVEDKISYDGMLKKLSADDVSIIEAAIDAISPSVCTQIETNCPECGEHQVLNLNPYSLSLSPVESIFEEVHVLAKNYHWGEDEILSLTRERRKNYLKYIYSGNGSYT